MFLLIWLLSFSFIFSGVIVSKDNCHLECFLYRLSVVHFISLSGWLTHYFIRSMSSLLLRALYLWCCIGNLTGCNLWGFPANPSFAFFSLLLAAPESLRFGIAEGGLSCFGVEVTIVSSTSYCWRRLSSVTVSIEEFRVLTAGLFAPLSSSIDSFSQRGFSSGVPLWVLLIRFGLSIKLCL